MNLSWLNPLKWFNGGKQSAPTVKLAPRAWEGDGTWPFIAVQDGDDIVLRARPGRRLFVTWFGGDDDPTDSGETASGVRTKGNPDCAGCALPMNYTPACSGSPIPKLPWNTAVTVYDSTTTLEARVPLIDVGPNRRTGNSIDLTQAVFKLFAPKRKGKFTAAMVRIHGAAKHFQT